MNKILIKFLKDKKEQYEADGLIPTLDLLIADLEENYTSDDMEAEEIALTHDMEADQKAENVEEGE